MATIAWDLAVFLRMPDGGAPGGILGRLHYCQLRPGPVCGKELDQGRLLLWAAGTDSGVLQL